MNALKFSIVREDSRTECDLIEARGLQTGAVLAVASGGCTLFEMKCNYPDLEVVGFDINPFQIAHVEAKRDRIAAGEWGDEPVGSFEELFDLFRYAVTKFVTTPSELDRYFEGELEVAQTWFENPYWGVAFKQAFHPDFLFAMFGPDAVQHATRPYASYFRQRFEEAMVRDGANRNRFLQHIFTGEFFEADRPSYMSHNATLDVSLVLGGIDDVPDLDRFDLVSVSNVFDWSDDLTVERWSDSLNGLKPGATLLIRQLNNDRDLVRFFPEFDFDETLGESLRQRDRSFFYEQIVVGTRR